MSPSKKTKTRPRVLVLTTTFPRWKNDSTPPFVYELCQNLSADFKITILAPHHPQAKFQERMASLRVLRFPYFFPLRWQKLCYEGGILPNIKKSLIAKIQVPFLIFSELIFAWKLTKKGKFDLIHAHWTIPQGIIALILKGFFNIPVLVTAHAGDVFTKNKVIKYINYFVIKYANFITVNSQATKDALLSFNRNPPSISIIPMGVDTEKFRPIRKEKIKRAKQLLNLASKRVILFVGRLAEKKGVSYLIKAIPKILKKFANSHLLIIGYGPEEERLKVLSQRLGLKEKITFLGKVPNAELPLYYNLSDVSVAPSIKTQSGDTEGLGIVLLEAMACGAPVIGTNIGGIIDIVEHKKTGLWAEEKNPDQIAKAVTFLFENPAVASKMESEGREKVIRFFSWKVVAKKFKLIYLNLTRLTDNFQ